MPTAKKKAVKKSPPKPRGRPETYTQPLADLICSKISDGQSLRSVCREEVMPSMQSVFRWLREKEGFSEQYARACEERAEAFAEDMLDIADGGIEAVRKSAEKKSGAVAQMVRLQVDTRKWHMSKMKPKKYGDKIDMTSGGKRLKGGNAIVFTDFSKNGAKG